MATAESESHANVKAAIVDGKDACTASVPKDFMLARDLANDFTRQYHEMKNAGASARELNDYLNAHSQYHAQHLGEADRAEICCGQVAGLIDDIPSAREPDGGDGRRYRDPRRGSQAAAGRNGGSVKGPGRKDPAAVAPGSGCLWMCHPAVAVKGPAERRGPGA